MSEIRICPRRMAAVSVMALVVLLVLHLLGDGLVAMGIRQGPINVLNMDYEESLPTVFNTILLLVCAGLLGAIAAGGVLTGRRRREWGVLAALFLYLAIDEGAGIHERV